MTTPLFSTLLLALVQGVAEFLPISSSGHLTILQHLLGIREDNLLLTVVLHGGTLLSVLLFFRKRIWELFLSLLRLPFRYKEVKPEERSTLLGLVVVTVITGAAGILFKDAIEQAFSSPAVSLGGLFFTGTLLLTTRFARERDRIPPLAHYILLGVAQSVAILPGISRSGSTIAVALLLGWLGAKAAEFSFLASLPAVAGALLLEIPKVQAFSNPGLLLLGFLISFFVGLASIALLLRVLRKGSFPLFGFYCLSVALLGTLLFVF